MKVRDIISLVNADIVSGGQEHLDLDIHSACGSDMMSDVLAYVKDQGMLITGLINVQSVRTAEMMDMKCILFVRGKMPDPQAIKLAEGHGMVLLKTEMTMFNACGVLFKAGIVTGGRSCPS